jgi:hypothetical protein
MFNPLLPPRASITRQEGGMGWSDDSMGSPRTDPPTIGCESFVFSRDAGLMPALPRRPYPYDLADQTGRCLPTRCTFTLAEGDIVMHSEGGGKAPGVPISCWTA